MILKPIDCLLECGCVWNDNGLPVKTGDHVLCRFHGPQMVKQIGLNHFQVFCVSCHYSNHGMRLKAEGMAVTHRKRYKSHIVDVFTPTGEHHHRYQPDAPTATLF